MKIIFAGGGTAGHINPAIAVANYTKSKDKDFKALFIGTKNGMESKLVPKSGYDIEFIDVQGFKRSLSPSNITAVFKAGYALHKSRKLIKKFAPDIVIGTGGYVSGPVVSAAASLGIPTLIHEQNVFAGMTSKMLSGKVDTVCISFEESRKVFGKAKNVVLTGNPLRPELFETDKNSARAGLGLDGKPFILAFGGSLGAMMLNKSICDFLECAKGENNFRMLFGTGEREFEAVSKTIDEKGLKGENIEVVPYINNMHQVMNAADIVIARAGAVTLSEINALGKAAILIPSPNVTDNHQEFNARALEKQGAATVITEDMLGDKEIMYKEVSKILNTKGQLEKMSSASLNMGIKDGTDKIYNEILKLTKTSS